MGTERRLTMRAFTAGVLGALLAIATAGPAVVVAMSVKADRKAEHTRPSPATILASNPGVRQTFKTPKTERDPLVTQPSCMSGDDAVEVLALMMPLVSGPDSRGHTVTVWNNTSNGDPHADGKRVMISIEDEKANRTCILSRFTDESD
jgi:hypothetical protein